MKQYQLSVQLSNVKRMLVNTKLSIKTIAKRCGFRSPEDLMHIFKKRLGMSPSQFRKMCQQEHLDKTFNVFSSQQDS